MSERPGLGVTIDGLKELTNPLGAWVNAKWPGWRKSTWIDDYQAGRTRAIRDINAAHRIIDPFHQQGDDL